MRHQKVDVSIDDNSPHFGSLEPKNALERARPRYALCGHIHSGDHNPYVVKHERGSDTIVCNVSRLNDDYRIACEPFVFEI